MKKSTKFYNWVSIGYGIISGLGTWATPLPLRPFCFILFVVGGFFLGFWVAAFAIKRNWRR